MKKIELKVNIYDQKIKTRVLKAITKLPGVDEVSIDSEKGIVTVIGDVDPVKVASQIRKTGNSAEIVSVGPPNPPDKAEEKKEDPPPPCHCNQCQLVPFIGYAPYDDVGSNLVRRHWVGISSFNYYEGMESCYQSYRFLCCKNDVDFSLLVCTATKIIELKVNLHDQKTKTKVLKAISKLAGVNEVSIDSEKGIVTVLGNVDPVQVATQIRKTGNHAEIIKVGPPKKPDSPPPPPPKPDKEEKPPSPPPPPCRCNQCQLVAVVGYAPYDNAGGCSIL